MVFKNLNVKTTSTLNSVHVLLFNITYVVVLIVLCFGVEFLCCLSLMYVFIFLVHFG